MYGDALCGLLNASVEYLLLHETNLLCWQCFYIQLVKKDTEQYQACKTLMLHSVWISVWCCRFYHKAVGAMIVFDVTVHRSFENVANWMKDLREHAEPSTVIMLIGNKMDLKHLQTVSVEEAEQLAGNWSWVS